MPKLTTILFLIFLTCSTNFVFSTENKNQDSISDHLQYQFKKYRETNIDLSIVYANRLIKHTQEISNDSLLIRTQQDMGNLYRTKKQLDSALYYYNTSLKIAKKIDNSYFISRAHILCGICFSRQSEFEKAIHSYRIATKITQQPDKYTHKLFLFNKVFAFNQLGTIYMERGDLKKALQAFLNANTIIEENNIEDQRINSLINIANLYSTDKQWGKALTKQNEILKLAKKDNDIYSQAIANNNIGTIYEDLKEYNKALTYYLKSLELRKSGNITQGLSSNYHNLGSINYRLGKYKQAIDFLNKSITISKEDNSKIDYVYNYECLANIYIKTKEYTKAGLFLSKAKALAEDQNLSNKKLDLAKLQTAYYFATGNLGLAEKAFFEYDSLKDLSIKNEKSETFIQMQTLYETDKKEKENDLLKAQNELSQNNLKEEIQRKNQFIISFGISIVILIIIIFLLRRMFGANKIIKDFNIKLEKSNEKLKLINNTKDKFSSIIAHDLRSPLGAILSFSNLIDDECNSSKEIETVAEYNTYLNQSARNLNSLLENLLQWSKSQLGNIKHYATDFNLSLVIEENIEIQKLKAKEKSIEIKSQIEENTHVYADINMVNTIIRNLLSNAIKFSYPKTEIIILTKVEDKMLHLSVQDRGIGINQDKQEKLFKIGSNLSTLGTNNETGTGLGLILCKEFAETNGGKIWITSEESKGSTFTFTIPLKEA
ncbi:tetratricopeptide repeat protein [Ancylomarina sp. 16SWW S1-10-2]|uniref:tetratricopeptide repeat-containing sensor histidine kinase n=1 Tax=Ancylomarina sp. 16SWW S1-10-2 TaxID=2499681 RepID=UPI0012AD7CFF|nr:tetratricopeptide repeat protein [Ancylomarina sp. 16SWW S1-10-2]MRT94396.1 tetratricopeptide repeat protein [Ancylomarina sp. 16SWW S1-10-2]